MSTQPISSSSPPTSVNSVATGSSLNSLGTGSPLQITGLASGLDTNSIVKALMAAQQQQVTNLQNQQSGLTALNTQLTSIQTALQTVSADAKALGSPTLFAKTQTISSTNPTLVGATATGSNGAVVGGYQISVTQLASASQRTFTFASPASDGTITIDGYDTSVSAGATAQDFVNALNSDSNAKVWATVTGTDPATGNQQIVLSERATGQPASPNGFVTVTGTNAGALTEQTQYAAAGQNALYSINNGSLQSSSSNTISGVALTGTASAGNPGATQTIPGVTLSLNGLTGSTPVSVNVSAPAPNTQKIQNAVQQFVTDYNSAVSQIQKQLTQTPSSSDPTQGTLFGDASLRLFLGNMRQQMDATLGGLTGSFTSMLDIGVSTGAASGSSAPSQSAIKGNLTLDVDTLTSALTNNASAVKSVFQSWSIKFSFMVDNQASPGGTIDSRINGDNTRISNLATQINNLNLANAQKQQQLVREFANMEGALSLNQSTASWLTSQLNALPKLS